MNKSSRPWEPAPADMADRTAIRGGTPLPRRSRRPFALPAAEARWRAAGILGVLLYLGQDLAGLRWEWLAHLQTDDVFKYVTGAGLMSYIGWQWWLFYSRVRGRNLRMLLAWHQRTGALVPLLFYLHSIEIGYGYLAALSWIFLVNMLVGAASPLGVRINNRYYTASWGIVHVSLAALTVLLGLFHAYIAVYYK